jgi:hypothetical protein
MKKVIRLLHGLYKFREVQLSTLSTQALQNFMCKKALGRRIYGHFISFLFSIFIYLAQMKEFIAKRKEKACHFISQNTKFRINDLLLSLEPFWNPTINAL